MWYPFRLTIRQKPMNKTDSFWKWAEKELDTLGLSWYRVEQLSGRANATISKRARERLPPTQITCEAIAHAFQMDKEEVFRIAGILPSKTPQSDKQAQQVLFLFNNLTPADQERLVIIMHSFIEAREQRDKGGDDTDVT